MLVGLEQVMRSCLCLRAPRPGFFATLVVTISVIQYLAVGPALAQVLRDAPGTRTESKDWQDIHFEDSVVSIATGESVAVSRKAEVLPDRLLEAIALKGGGEIFYQELYSDYFSLSEDPKAYLIGYATRIFAKHGVQVGDRTIQKSFTREGELYSLTATTAGRTCSAIESTFGDQSSGAGNKHVAGYTCRSTDEDPAGFLRSVVQSLRFDGGRLNRATAGNDQQPASQDSSLSRSVSLADPLAFSPEEAFSRAQKYRLGDGVPQDEPTAFRFYRLAAEAGHNEAQYWLGDAYRLGKGIDVDEGMAFRWYSRAHENGNLRGQNAVGMSFLRGIGVGIDASKAYDLIRDAAEQGFARSMANIGNFYRDGIAVAKDPVEAYFWYLLADTYGFEPVKKRRKIAEARLNPVQIIRVSDRVLAWRPGQTIKSK